MLFRSLFCAAVAVPLLAGGAAHAFPFGQERPAAESDGGSGFLPRNWLGGRDHTARVELAQAGDPRIPALEEQVRDLNGKVEELNFLLLQMQDQIRKMQEDNEFRLRQLEEKQGNAGSATGNRLATGDAPAAPGQPAQATAPAAGTPPQTLGTVTFDANGNPTGGTLDATPQAPGQGEAMMDHGGENTDDTRVAALPPTDDPEELYRNAYNFILSGDYPTAEAGFREHIDRFPNDPKTADAHYWLGEALLGMEQYRSAAEIFLAANREFPDSGKAPDMLLKLGVSLSALNQRDVACATYAEIGKRYKSVSAALKERVRAEQALAGC